jgi:hypothetical protein
MGKVKSILPTAQAPENQAGSLPRQVAGRFLLVVEFEPALPSLTIGQGVKLIVLGQEPGALKSLFAWLYEATRL